MSSHRVASPCPFVKVVHFSFGFFDSKMPPRVADHIRRTRDDNPDFEVMVWGPAEARALIAKHYPSFLTKYDAFDIPIQKSDASRYVILHKYGGVYTDLDYRFKAPLREVLRAAYACGAFHESEPQLQPRPRNTSTLLAFVNETPNGTVFRRRASNSFMGANQPGHPFWLQVMDDITAGWGPRHQKVLSSAGPQAVDRALSNWVRRHDFVSKYPVPTIQAEVIMLPKAMFNPCSVCDRNALTTVDSKHVLAYHGNGGTWHSPFAKVVNTLYCDWAWAVAVASLLIVVITVATTISARRVAGM
jgi:mannosyltransferase OCH1-like enzyme